MSRRTIALLFSMGLGLLLVAAVASWAGLRDSWSLLERIGLGGCLLYAAYCALILFLQGLGWWILLRGDEPRANLPLAMEGMLVGHAFSFVTPSAYLGGEPVRAWLVSRRLGLPLRRTFATVLLHKFQEFSGFLFFLLLGTWIVLAEWRSAIPPVLQIGLVAFTATATACFAAFFRSFLRGTRLLSSLLERVARRRPEGSRWRRGVDIAREIEDRVHASLHTRRTATMIAHGLTASSLGLVWFKPAILLSLAGIRAPFSAGELALFFVSTQVLMGFQPTPGGLGVQEGGFTGVYSLLGVAPHEAMAFMAAVRMADILLVGAGLALGARAGWRTLAGADVAPQGAESA